METPQNNIVLKVQRALELVDAVGQSLAGIEAKINQLQSIANGTLAGVEPQLTPGGTGAFFRLIQTKSNGNIIQSNSAVFMRATASKAGLMSASQAKTLDLLDKVLLELTGIGDERSLEIYANWDPEVTSMREMFKNDKTIVCFPKVDTSKVTTFQYAFQGCTNLVRVASLDLTGAKNTRVAVECMFESCTALEEIGELKTTGLTDFGGLFLNTKALRTIPSMDTSSATQMTNMFNGAEALEVCPALDSRNVVEMMFMFSNCKSLRRIEGLNVAKCTSLSSMLTGCESLEYANIVGFGTCRSYNTYYGGAIAPKGATKWGAGTEENRQSLVDTYLTNSFDRAAAGYPAWIITLEPEVLSRLTDEEIAAITAKGYTLTSY